MNSKAMFGHPAGSCAVRVLATAAVALLIGLVLGARADAKLLTIYRLPASLNYAEAIAAGPDGALWFSQDAVLGPRSQLVLGRITTGGAVSSMRLPRDARPISLAIGPDNLLWYASWSAPARLGRITPQGVQELALPGFEGSSAVVTGPDGALWFSADDRIGRLAADGSIATYVVPDTLYIEQLVTGSDGALWFPVALRIGRIDMSGTMRFFRLPLAQSPQHIVAGPDGAVWFSGATCECIGRMSTAGHVRIFRLPGAPDPAALAAGADGAIWFAHALGLGRITMTGEITTFALPEPGSYMRFVKQLAVGPDSAMWFTLQDFNVDADDDKPASSAIGRIDVGGPNASRLLVARLDDAPLRGRAGAMMRVRFTSTRRAGGSLSIVRQTPRDSGWRTVARTRVAPGVGTVRVRLPRRPGTYRVQLRLQAPSQVGSDSALVRVSG